MKLLNRGIDHLMVLRAKNNGKGAKGTIHFIKALNNLLEQRENNHFPSKEYILMTFCKSTPFSPCLEQEIIYRRHILLY